MLHNQPHGFNADPRFAKFGAAQISQVFNNTRQVSKNGGNNIWERGIVHPEEGRRLVPLGARELWLAHCGEQQGLATMRLRG